MVLRYILVLVLVAGYCCEGYGQGGQNRYDFVPPENVHTHHAKATELGKGMMILGGLATGIGGIALAQKPTDDFGYLGTGNLFAEATIATGLSIVVVGAVVFIAGKSYEARHPQLFSVTGNKNSVGIAYRF